MKKETVGECFEVLKCPKCDSQSVRISDLDSHNEVWMIKCLDCGEEFTKPIK